MGVGGLIVGAGLMTCSTASNAVSSARSRTAPPLFKIAEGHGPGSAQRRAFWLERAGLAKSVRVGKRRHVVTEPSDLLKTTVQDFEDLRRLPIALGVRPEMGLGEALAALEKRGEKKPAGSRIGCEVHALANWGSIRWRRYYRRDDCRDRNDDMLGKGVEDLLPPNKGLYVGSLIKTLIGIRIMPRTTGELEELRRLLRNIGAPRCSKSSTTRSVLDWIWRGHIPINIPRPLASAEP